MYGAIYSKARIEDTYMFRGQGHDSPYVRDQKRSLEFLFLNH